MDSLLGTIDLAREAETFDQQGQLQPNVILGTV
jgi:hypothetical protein